MNHPRRQFSRRPKRWPWGSVDAPNGSTDAATGKAQEPSTPEDRSWCAPPSHAWRAHRPAMHSFHTTWRRRRAPLFFRFIVAFGLIVFLMLGGMSVLGYLMSRLFGPGVDAKDHALSLGARSALSSP